MKPQVRELFEQENETFNIEEVEPTGASNYPAENLPANIHEHNQISWKNGNTYERIG